jgi:periplasmic mercuric ion binding protein
MMKSIKNIILVIAAILLPLSAVNGQGANIEKIKIQTSAQCGMCKEAIEETLAFERGVKKSVLIMKTKVVEVEYDKRRTSPEKIRKAISKIGYDADDVPADKKAYEKLEACCKKPDDPNFKPH